MRSPTDRRRGAALLISIGFLSVLVLLAVAFSRLVGVEARAAGNEVEAARARMAADAGIEFACQSLRSDLAVEGFLGPTGEWYFRPARHGGYDPLSIAERPSYAAFADGDAGRLPTSPDGSTAGFRLKILDASGMLWIGGLDPSRTGATLEEEGRRRRHVGQILERLCRLLGLERGLGNWLMTVQPAGGWRDKRELRSVLTPEQYARLASHVTCRPGWVDHDQARAIGPPFPPAFEEAFRVPVNVNTASPYVLAALVEGVWAVRRTAERLGADRIGYRTERSAPIDRSVAIRVAQKLVATREVAPLGTVEDLRYFLLGLVASGDLAPDQAAALHATFNPNADGNWFNHDPTLHRVISKNDVGFGSTELVFHPTGVFEIESEGRVRSAAGEIVARARARATVRILGMERLTTQDQLEANYEGGVYTAPAPAAVAVAGDEIGSIDPVARFDGQVVLTGIADSTADGDVVFQAPCLGTLAPWRANVRSPDRRRGFLGTAALSVLESDVGPGVPASSNLHHDGVFFDFNRMSTLIYPTQSEVGVPLAQLKPSQTNLPVAEGRLEFWFKLDDWTTVLDSFPLFLGTNPYGAVEGLQTKIYYRHGMLIASRYYFEGLRDELAGARYAVSDDGQTMVAAAGDAELNLPEADGAPPSDPTERPEELLESYARVDLPFEPAAHRWVHVSLSWKNYVELALEVDGVVKTGPPRPIPDDGFKSVLPHNWADMYFGPVYFDAAGRFRKKSTAGPTALPSLRHAVWTLTDPPRYTLAGLSIRDRFTDPASVPVPTRYPVAGPGRDAPVAMYLGRVPLPPEARPVALSWTEYETDTTFLDVYYAAGDDFLAADAQDGRPVPLPRLAPPAAGAPNDLVYLVRITDEGAEPLLATPVFDDVTVLYLVPIEVYFYEVGDEVDDPSAAADPDSPFSKGVRFVGTWYLPEGRRIRGPRTVIQHCPATGQTIVIGPPPVDETVGGPGPGRLPPEHGGPPVLQPPPKIPGRNGGPPPVWTPARPPVQIVTPGPKNDPAPYISPPVRNGPPVTYVGSPIKTGPPTPYIGGPIKTTPPTPYTGGPITSGPSAAYDPGPVRTRPVPTFVQAPTDSGSGGGSGGNGGSGLYRAGQ